MEMIELREETQVNKLIIVECGEYGTLLTYIPRVELSRVTA